MQRKIVGQNSQKKKHQSNKRKITPFLPRVILVHRGSACKQADGKLDNLNQIFWGSPGIFQ